MAEFDNRTVMITGAAGNLGRALADAFSAAGARRILVDRSEAHLAAAYPKAPAGDRLLAADLTDATDAQRALAAAGRVDALCNLAGGFRMGPAVHETPDELWRGMLELNAGTLLNAVRAVVPGMLAAGSGSIVNVAALAGTAGRAQMGAYGAAKSAVIRLTESMSAELRERGINVNCVMPSILDTPQNRADMPKADPRRWVPLDALAEVIVFLASPRARAIHGAAIPVSGLS